MSDRIRERDIAKGADLIKIKEYNPDQEVEINGSTYLRIIKFVHDHMSVRDTATARQNYLRIVGDLCRIQAVEDNMSWKFARQIINWNIDAYNQIGLYYREKETKRPQEIVKKVRTWAS
jgi:hypothetical protein